jgi:ribA/ribD-fused uncharacterized protein
MNDKMFDEVGVKPGKPYKFGDWKQYAVHNDKEIKGFFGEYRFLSNFQKADIEYEGDIYNSTECAFQASKVVKEQRERLQHCEPYESKKLWKTLKKINETKEQWDARRLKVMMQVSIEKYLKHSWLREKLLATGERYLEETNHWNDRYWGVDIHKGGENQLGKLLMNVRTYFRSIYRGK